ncbi:MAG: GH116 family glycosyl-hydrolase, partial [Bacteroidales bacterium]
MTDQPKKNPAPCDPASGCCSGSSGIDRRSFLKSTAAGASLMMIPGLPAFAGPFDENEYLKYIPADKKLDPAWVRSLFLRGTKETYTDPAALEQIGMPVGGLFAGTVYLAGDGRLWLWDIFNRDQEGILPKTVEYGGREVRTRDGANYVEPAKVFSPFKQGFELIIGDRAWPLDKSGFESVEFDGRYPMGIIRYSDPGCPVEVTLEAFSPFIPGNAAASSLPTTIMRFTIKNLSDREVTCAIRGYTENPVCLDSAKEQPGYRQNRVVQATNQTALLCEALPARKTRQSKRKDILFEDFESEDYGSWIVTGNAFGSGPIRRSDVPDYQGELGGEGERLVNSHASATGNSVGGKDGAVGSLTSREFTIERNFIAFYIGGGSHKGRTSLDLLIDGQVVASVTGKERNAMELASIKTDGWMGRKAVIRIVDEVSGGWGNIGVDHIVFTDTPPNAQDLSELRDFGTFCLTLFGHQKRTATADLRRRASRKARTGELTGSLIGSIAGEARLLPGDETNLEFAFTWHFPNFYGRDFGGVKVGHSYAARFGSALDVAAYISENKDFLIETTRSWVET